MVAHRCEVLIIGGGVLGVWLLDNLISQGYHSPLLLELDSLGCRQTCHSHAFLHQGYAYYGATGAETFFDAWTRWQTWPTPPLPPPRTGSAHHAFLDNQKYRDAVTWRSNARFPAPPASHQFGITHPDIQPSHDAISTDERCIPADDLVDHLQNGKQAHIRKIQRISSIGLVNDPSLNSLRVDSVSVILDDGTTWTFEPQTLVLCTGGQNQVLSNPANFSLPAGASLPQAFTNWNQMQRDTNMDMLVGRDTTQQLPDFNGSIWGDGLSDPQGQFWNVQAFVVNRRDANRDQIWIFSGEVYQTDANNRKTSSFKTGKFCRRMLIDYLRKVFPSFAQSYQQMQWGVYEASLATMNRAFLPNLPPLGRRKLTDMGIEGLLVCYTDRLTITPLAVEEIEAEISLNLRLRWRVQQLPLPALPPQPVAVSQEYWSLPAQWLGQVALSWPNFQMNYL